MTQAPVLPLHVQPVGQSGPEMHTLQTLLTQREVLQSAAPAQPFPRPQRAQSGPPQSTSVSLPFLMPSLHVGARQTCPWHTPLAQSGEP